MRTEAELKILAEDIFNGRVFGTWLGEHAIDSFLILRLAGAPIGACHAFEYLDKAGPMAINGQPMFMSCQFVDREEAVIINENITQLKEARENYLQESGK
jgi:hypothetical protein